MFDTKLQTMMGTSTLSVTAAAIVSEVAAASLGLTVLVNLFCTTVQ